MRTVFWIVGFGMLWCLITMIFIVTGFTALANTMFFGLIDIHTQTLLDSTKYCSMNLNTSKVSYLKNYPYPIYKGILQNCTTTGFAQYNNNATVFNCKVFISNNLSGIEEVLTQYHEICHCVKASQGNVYSEEEERECDRWVWTEFWK